MIGENSRKILFYSIKICGGKTIEEIVSKSSGSQVVDRFITIYSDHESRKFLLFLDRDLLLRDHESQDRSIRSFSRNCDRGNVFRFQQTRRNV